MNSGIKEIYKLIKKNETITIFGHINPDGDCYGSSLALRELIRLNFPKKKVFSLAGTLPQLEQRLTTQDKDVSAVVLLRISAILSVRVPASDKLYFITGDCDAVVL